jgi:hypothetical protein
MARSRRGWMLDAGTGAATWVIGKGCILFCLLGADRLVPGDDTTRFCVVFSMSRR